MIGPRTASAPATPESRARALYLAGLERLDRFDPDSATRLFAASWSTDPTYLPPLIEPIYFYGGASFLPRALLASIDAIAARMADTVFASCLRGLPTVFRGATYTIDTSLARTPAARRCIAMQGAIGAAGSAERALPHLKSLRREWRESLVLGWLEFGARGELSDRAGLAVLGNEMRHTSSALGRAMGYLVGIHALHALGKEPEAAVMERLAEAVTRRSGGLARVRFLSYSSENHRGIQAGMPSDPGLTLHARAVVASAESALARALKGADPVTTLMMRMARATALLDNGELEASLSEYSFLRRASDSLGAPDLLAGAEMLCGRALVKLGRLKEAEQHLLVALDAARRAGHLQLEYQSEHNLLHLYEAMGRDVEARRAGEAFVLLTERGAAQPVKLMARHDLAWFFQRRGLREAARPHFQAMLAWTDSLSGYRYWAGEYHELTGDLERARESYRRAIVTKREFERVYSGLSRVAEAVGDVDSAIYWARQHDAERGRRGYPEHAPLTPGVLARHGRVAEAAVELRRTREVARGRGQVAAWASLTADLAAAELRLGHYGVSAALADSAAHEAGQVASVDVRTRSLAIAGLALVREGTRSQEGWRRLRSASREARRMAQPALEADVLTDYGEALAASGRVDEALVTLSRAADRIDSLAVTLAHDPARAGFRAARVRVSNLAFGAIVSRAASTKAADRYAQWSVRRKNRGLWDAAAPLRGRGPIPLSVSLDAIGRRLTRDEAVIDFVVGDSFTAALVITDQGARVHRLPVGPDSVRARLRGLLGRLVPRVGDYVDTSHAVFDRHLAGQLYRDLIVPLEAVLAARTRLVIVADGPLHFLPFDALVAHAGDSTVFLLDRYTVSYAPSLAGFGSVAPLVAGQVLAVAGPGVFQDSIEGATELDGVAALPGRAQRLVVDAATESALRVRAGEISILHLAVHARPNDEDPASAYLSLTPANGDDGLLHAYEIERLRLHGALVVLSACETGAGRLAEGEGVLSLSRAFLRGGAGGTIATLWPVGPATTDLMAAFYRELSRGRSTAEALRLAKLEQRRGRWSNPFHWAGFTLITR